MAQLARRWELDTMLRMVFSCQILDFPGYVGGKGRHGLTSKPAQTAKPAATRGYKYLELQEQLSLLNFMFILHRVQQHYGQIRHSQQGFKDSFSTLHCLFTGRRQHLGLDDSVSHQKSFKSV